MLYFCQGTLKGIAKESEGNSQADQTDGRELRSMAKVAYVRVSTEEQNEARQIEALKRYGIDKYFTEKISGKTTKGRKQLESMLDYVRESDTVYIESFSRLARNTADLLDIMKKLEAKKVHVVSCKERIDTSTAAGKMMLTMIAAIYEFERDCLKERQREGIAIAKANGKYKGGARKEKPSDWEDMKAKYKQRELSVTDLAAACGVSRPLIYKWLKE